jgi:hypothetical protein
MSFPDRRTLTQFQMDCYVSPYAYCALDKLDGELNVSNGRNENVFPFSN